MPHTTMLTSVFQATILWTLAAITWQYSTQKAFTPIEDYQDAYKRNQTEASIRDAIARNGTLSVGSLNFTSWNSKSDLKAANDKFLYTEIPKSIFIYFVLSVLRYWWLMALERYLPARPRAQPVPATPLEKEDDDCREEEVIRKWIEAGKVRRASLSWGNTFAKWMLDLTVGNFWQTLLHLLMECVMELKWPWKEFGKWELLLACAFNWFGVGPFATLIAFILVPAHKRIVFEAGVDLAWKVFWGAFLHVVIPWAMEKDFVQQALKNATQLDQGGNITVKALNDTGSDEL